MCVVSCRTLGESHAIPPLISSLIYAEVERSVEITTIPFSSNCLKFRDICVTCGTGEAEGGDQRHACECGDAVIHNV